MSSTETFAGLRAMSPRSRLTSLARLAMLLLRLALNAFLNLARSILANWFLSNLILDRSTFFQSTSFIMNLSRSISMSLKQLSMSTSPSQCPPRRPQSSQSTAAHMATPVIAAAK